MKFSRNKAKVTAISFVLVLTFSAMLVALPTVSAHDPRWEIPTWTGIGVSPTTVGVGQSVVVVFWQNMVPPTANGAYGDRWSFNVEVTKTDGSKEILGPFTSDPVGGGYTIYTPDQVGTYTFVAKFIGKVLDNTPGGMSPSGVYAGSAMAEASNVTEFLGDYWLPSESEPVALTVVSVPLPNYVETPLPTDQYWERPIYGANRDWWKVAANWLSGAAQNVGPTTNFNYGTSPASAHILWAKQYWAGGIMDARFESKTYQTTHYEGLRFSPIIIQGKLFYSVSSLPKEGWYCVDLYTGETDYFHNTTGKFVRQTLNVRNEINSFDSSGGLLYGNPAFGQIYDYESPNQHGGFPYLWVTSTGKPNTWDMLDAFTGNLICSIGNVSSRGTNVYGKEGSILYYNFVGSGANKRLTVWNTSDVIMNRWNWSEIGGNSYWMWRPYFNYTFDGSKGFSLNVSIPDVSGSIFAVREGEFIIGGTAGTNKVDVPLVLGNLWCLSLERGQEGTLLWNRTFTPPQGVPAVALQDLQFSAHDVALSGRGRNAVDPEDGVFLFENSMTRERWVYSLDTMELLWKSEPEPQMNLYGMSISIYQGKLFSYGYGGELIAYNIKTGEILWNWSAPSVGYLETPYQHTPLSMGVIADGKLYLYSSEHSPNTPLRRDCKIYCVDANTGEMHWALTFYPSGMALADGRIVALDYFDNQIYCIGKGPSALTVEAPMSGVTVGSSVMIKGTVTDQSPGAPDTPAISDESMDDWMEYLYHERPIPTDAEGVEVVLETLDPNGNTHEIGRTNTDISGGFGLSFTPQIAGDYKITATFEGSESYASSMDITYLVVTEAPSPAQPIEPEEPTAEAPFITTEIAIIAAVVIAVVIGIVAYWALRKRK